MSTQAAEDLPEPEPTEVPMSPLTQNPLAVCAECGHSAHWLGEHVVTEHGMSHEAYLAKHPGALLASKDTSEKAHASSPAPRAPTSIKMDIGGVKFPVHLNVPQEASAPMPPHYRLPQHGDLANTIEDALLVLADINPVVFFFGRGGTGKDAFPEFVSYVTRQPYAEYTIQPDADIEAWFFSRTFDNESAYWEEGPLLKQLRDGYQPPDGGKPVPYLIKFTDTDRATPRQAEHLRPILGSSRRWVQGPQGKQFPVLEGTKVVMTGNTNGAGDITGRFVSARAQDSTLIERYHAFFEFSYMEWEDEVEIVRSKFPRFVRECEAAEIMVNGAKKTVNMLEEVGKSVTRIRQDIAADKLYTDFSHRHLCWWLMHAERRINHRGVEPDLLSRSAQVWLSRIGDRRTRMEVEKTLDALITGGVLSRGRKK